MVEYVKVKGTEIELSTANTVGGATVVRVYAPSAALVTFAYANGVSYGTYTLPAGSEEAFIKEPADMVSANTAVRAVSIAYK